MPAAWGDLIARMAEERCRAQAASSAGAIRRLREWGARGTIAYALGRRRIDDQAAAYSAVGQSASRSTIEALEKLRAGVEALPYRPLISVITPVHNTPPDVLSACLDSVRRSGIRQLGALHRR